MFIKRVFAEPRDNRLASTTRTADDRAYTARAVRDAAEAGIRNPERYVRTAVAQSNRGAGVASRNRVVGAINRRRNG